MFQISKYMRGASDSGFSKSRHDVFFAKRKNPYEVLIKVSRWIIFCYHLRSILIGLWILLKWCFQFLWHTIQQSTRYQQQIALTPINHHSYFHDKPPPCLVDNRIGLQSYVKLKGTKLHYIEAGNRCDPLILLLHGFPDCWLGWHNQVVQLHSTFLAHPRSNHCLFPDQGTVAILPCGCTRSKGFQRFR